MKWGKIILFFQAIVTLILGIIFFTQALNIDIDEEAQTSTSPLPIDINISEIKTRFSIASYVLLFVSLTELIIISRLLT
jgi:hypothetical protein